MKKKLFDAHSWSLIMKISSIQIMMALVLTTASWASSSAQEMLNQRVNLIIKDASLRTILSEISQNTGVRITYNSKIVTPNLRGSLQAKNKPLSRVLDELLSPESITYMIIDDQIILRKKENNVGAQEDKHTENILHTQPGPEVRKLEGTVKDEEGIGLPGVNVIVKGTQQGTTTDQNGAFQIELTDAPSVLVFSFVGYTSQELSITNQNRLDIVMKIDDKALEELVVVGYGSVQKKDLTGSVSSVQGEVIANRKTTQISQALQGTMPGVMVTRSSNAPGSTASIRIRGITTISGEGANPLIILDGVPVDDINSINPNDVESISVLKDAASASIYGSRAAAGVIVVTTKRAKSGQLNLDYSFEYGSERPTNLAKYVGAQRFMQLTNELRWNDNGNNTNEYPTYSKDMIENYNQLNQENPDLYPNTNWQDLILKKSAPRTSHILSIAAAGKMLRSRVSMAYDNTDGLFDGRKYERITARMNNDITISKYLSASVDLNFKRTQSEQTNIDPFYMMNLLPPIYAAKWSDGRIAAGKDGANVYGAMQAGTNTGWYNQIGGKVGLDFSPVEGLKLSAVVSPFLNFDKSKRFVKKVPYTSFDNPGVTAGYIEGATETSLYESRNDNYRYTTQFLANYNKQWGDHSFSALGGYEFFKAFNEYLGASRRQYNLSNYPYLNLGPLDQRDNSGTASENAYRSFFGRVTYGFKNKYLLQANLRYDGSSRFASGYRWGAFPSISAGWVLSEENFLKNKANAISFLKLRASWGTLGNERIGSNYPYQAILSFENSSLFYQGNTVTAAQSAAQFQYAIRDISWETTSSYDLGVDANFFNDRLQITADYYKKTTRDMLLELEIPDYIGFDNPDQNTGKMFTTGWEMQAGWNDRIGNLGYRASFNLSDFVSKMGDLGGTEFLGDQIKKQNSEFNEWYGYQSIGLFQTADEVTNSAVTNSNVRAGDIRYKDISGPEGVPDGKISPEYDRVLLGGSLPRYMFGPSFGLNFKNFDLSFTFQGVGHQNSRITSSMIRPLLANFGNFPALLDGSSWSNYNTPEQNLQAIYPRYTNVSAGNNYAMSDFWMFNGGYIRLKNVSLGYQIPSTITEKLHIQGIRLYGTFSDVFALHRFPKGWDPEMNGFNYPITTAMVFGISVKF
ncbi:TonB-dependent receptor [Dyadobacter tibetensis]|uniref:TonB-dependent receptor n=1 Tax=Dyadobacter tibetensis TaxID=1211851 RepID=UPI00046FE38B|nr:TonB-dependent receptor [Dyadobacter tibetensis]